VNYDACHFALEYDAARASLDALVAAGIRISKIHLSSALALDPRDPRHSRQSARSTSRSISTSPCCGRTNGISRFADLPLFFEALENGTVDPDDFEEMRVHFHIPLDAEPAAPLRSTRNETREVLAWRNDHPDACAHYEIETYTWGVLPEGLQRPVEGQIAGEYAWVISHAR
jgi:hypothetical protein